MMEVIESKPCKLRIVPGMNGLLTVECYAPSRTFLSLINTPTFIITVQWSFAVEWLESPVKYKYIAII